MLFALRNVSHVQDIDAHWMAVVADVLQQQMLNHFAPAWEQAPGALIVVPPDIDPRSHGATAVITIYDNADQPGALGDHELLAGLPTGRVFTTPILGAGGTLNTGAL